MDFWIYVIETRQSVTYYVFVARCCVVWLWCLSSAGAALSRTLIPFSWYLLMPPNPCKLIRCLNIPSALFRHSTVPQLGISYTSRVLQHFIWRTGADSSSRSVLPQPSNNSDSELGVLFYKSQPVAATQIMRSSQPSSKNGLAYKLHASWPTFLEI